MYPSLFTTFALFASVFAHAIPDRRDASSSKTPFPTAAMDALQLLAEGHSNFLSKVKDSDPDLLRLLVENGQSPSFSFLGCSDSRVSEGTVFDAKPGTLFTHRNIANIYQPSDNAASSFLAYGVSALGVQHVVVMGHYGCGGVQAAIMSPPNGTIDASMADVQAWINPIRELYASSTRAEVVALREANDLLDEVPPPGYDDPGFQALIEENVKRSARTISRDPVIVNQYQALAATSAVTRRAGHSAKTVTPVFIHSWVYDLRTGGITDLDYSFGPPGYDIPKLASILDQAS